MVKTFRKVVPEDFNPGDVILVKHNENHYEQYMIWQEGGEAGCYRLLSEIDRTTFKMAQNMIELLADLDIWNFWHKVYRITVM